ncbi:16S rRNA (guanine(966)-N(2))-methyltransferase RsmD [Granulicoccus sp. GXG6511]|uniref:16S rRNA (guanine(966)-N(2))-methyltransferase RsmD n=1 Tax=Granulicoccus sp. GXG6511 TaxID=3381351 RepID=UPI003D7DAEAC
MSRIIAGSAKGHRIAAPAHSLTRPTTDRVREALFSALGSWFWSDSAVDEALAGRSFLDLYAGSGAIGLEAASRGAAPVWLVEADKKTADLIRTNARTTGLDVTVRTGRVAQVLSAGPDGTGFDVGWLDPPYDVSDAALAEALALLAAHGWILPAGLIVVERSRRSPDPEWPPAVERAWSRRYGETTLHFAELEET